MQLTPILMWVIRGYFSWDKLVGIMKLFSRFISGVIAFVHRHRFDVSVVEGEFTRLLCLCLHFGPKFIQKGLRDFKFRCIICKCQISQGLADIAKKLKPSRILQGFAVDRPPLPCNPYIPFLPLVCSSSASLTPDCICLFCCFNLWGISLCLALPMHMLITEGILLTA